MVLFVEQFTIYIFVSKWEAKKKKFDEIEENSELMEENSKQMEKKMES